MKFHVLGMDPSLSNWGMASGLLDLDTGVLEIQDLVVTQPDELSGKQVRQNSKDLHRSEQLAKAALTAARAADVVFVETPVGSQSARAMASYGVCVGILGAIRSEGIPLIEVTPTEVKLSLTRMKDATKVMMIHAAVALYPSAPWPLHNKKLNHSKAEHLADAIATIHAGVKTPLFQQLMRLRKGRT